MSSRHPFFVLLHIIQSMAGIYIHIPFCKSRCTYCNFYSTTNLSLLDELVNAICKEMCTQMPYIVNETIETIYFGGGTPSLLKEKHFIALFEQLSKLYNISNKAEITLEANPDDLSIDYIQLLKRFPFNRISIGIQSFINKELKLINRRHSAIQALEAVSLCQQHGFENISVDLIYGYPSQLTSNLSTSIDKLLSIRPKHISAYLLSYEKSTALYQQLIRHEISEINEETAREMYKMLHNKLTKAGYIAYEISNFALPGFDSKHNSAYWAGKHYLGLGPAAHSYNGSTRKWNVSNLNTYLNGIKHNTEIATLETLTEKEKYNEYLLTALRTNQGISIEFLVQHFGQERMQLLKNQSLRYINNGLLAVSGNSLRLTLDGFLISDNIIADLMWID